MIVPPPSRFRDPQAPCIRTAPLLIGALSLSSMLITSGCRNKGTQDPDQAQECERVENPTWPLRVFLQPSPTMNPDAQGNPLDTQLRFYQLAKANAAGAVTSVTELWGNDAELLGDVLLKRDDQIAHIGRPYSFEVQREPTSTHLLTAGLLRESTGKDFMRELPLPVEYTKHSCIDQAAKAPPPCLFVLVEAKRVLASYTPPLRFNLRGIPVESCPTQTQLFPATAAKPEPSLNKAR